MKRRDPVIVRAHARRAQDARELWVFRRAVARVEVIERDLAHYATEFCRRPLRRVDVAPRQSAVELPGVRWFIDGELVVEFLPAQTRQGADTLLVHDVALLAPLRRRLRTRHVHVLHACLFPAH